MTDEQRRVHLRLISTLPVRSHAWGPVTTPWGFKRSPDQEGALKAKLQELEAQGRDRNYMKAAVGCSCQTIIKHLGRHNKKKKATK